VVGVGCELVLKGGRRCEKGKGEARSGGARRKEEGEREVRTRAIQRVEVIQSSRE